MRKPAISQEEFDNIKPGDQIRDGNIIQTVTGHTEDGRIAVKKQNIHFRREMIREGDLIKQQPVPAAKTKPAAKVEAPKKVYSENTILGARLMGEYPEDVDEILSLAAQGVASTEIEGILVMKKAAKNVRETLG